MIRRVANNFTRRASRGAFMVTRLAIALSLMMSVRALFGAENTGTVSQPLVGGSLVSPYAQEELGLLTLNTATGSCSASLLTNEWAITAAHCVEVTIGKPPTVAPATVTLTANWSTVQKQTAAQINTFRTAGYDVAIVRVVKPFVVLKSTSSYKRLALDAAAENLQNYKIEMYGRGINQFAKGSGPTATPSQSDGQYRVGVATIGRYENNLNWAAYMTASVAGGDSGGPLIHHHLCRARSYRSTRAVYVEMSAGPAMRLLVGPRSSSRRV
jgi:Trypsin